MVTQMEYLGKKIKELASGCEPDSTLQLESESSSEFIATYFANPECMSRYLHQLLGEYVHTLSPEIKQELISFANLLGQKSAGSMWPLESILQLIYDSRAQLLELLEQEGKNGNITISGLFEGIKLLEPLYHLMENTIVSYYNEILSSTRFALDESTEDLRITLREVSDFKQALNEATIFAITDRNDRMVYVNDKFCKVSKYTKEELLGQTHFLLNSGYHPQEFFLEVWECIEAGNIWRGEILNKAKDGTTYWVDTTIVPFTSSNGERYQHISIQYDITEQKRAEETLQKMEKLSMVGELAAGFAHEIRNPLTTIKGFVQLMTESKKDQLFAKTILEEIDRINNIVSEFMVFAKPHSVNFSKCNLTSILRTATAFLEPEAILKDVLLLTDFPDEDFFILGEKNQLKQVFLNILKNAIEAMPNGGTVTIKLGSCSAGGISVSIADTGVGLDETQIKRLGEPFFTTKATGTGLGLMVTYKIIQNHRGRIHVESEGHGKGSTFTITFPGEIHKQELIAE